MGYDHFTLNNVRYHGADLTVVWQRPGGTTFYPNAPAGYTVYVNGLRAFTVSDLAHVSWNSGTGAVSVLDGSATQVLFNAAPHPQHRGAGQPLRQRAGGSTRSRRRDST
jgi:hypothetical protein